MEFERVLIYPTKNILDWIEDHEKQLKEKSRAGFYVAVTRAKNSVAFLCDEKFIKKNEKKLDLSEEDFYYKINEIL